MGLIEPTEGVLRIDDEIITKNNIRGWHKIIAHVPQNVILTDENIIKNIAFGKNDNEINLDRVYRAAKMARIYDDICSWKHKFETLVGENGVKLSEVKNKE